MITWTLIGIIAGILISYIFAVAASSKKLDFVKRPDLDADLSSEQAIQQLQEIKPYFAYKGKTWTALDMAIKAIQKGEENGEDDIL